MATPDDLDSNEFGDLGGDTELDGLDDIDLDGAADDDDIDDVDYDDDDGDEDEGKKSKKPGQADGSGEGSDEEGDADEPDLEDEVPDEEEESLDVILAREQDLEDEFAPAEEAPRASPQTTPAGEDEFTCRSCFLVKRRAQLADEEEWICLDCA